MIWEKSWNCNRFCFMVSSKSLWKKVQIKPHHWCKFMKFLMPLHHFENIYTSTKILSSIGLKANLSAPAYEDRISENLNFFPIFKKYPKSLCWLRLYFAHLQNCKVLLLQFSVILCSYIVMNASLVDIRNENLEIQSPIFLYIFVVSNYCQIMYWCYYCVTINCWSNVYGSLYPCQVV